jgi:hypothetical protein
MTEITMVGEYVSCYARLSICENRRQWVHMAALCRAKNNRNYRTLKITVIEDVESVGLII